MPVRPPKALAPKDDLKQDPLSAALEQEILAEKAATYSRLVQRLEKALAQLREFELAHGDSASDARGPARARPNGRAEMPVLGLAEGKTRGASRPSGGLEISGESIDKEHEALLNAAGRALWYVMIQRDLCGFRRHDLFYKELKVPRSVRLRMGIARSR